MYFTNISDTELSQYHKQIRNNFSIRLSTILTTQSDLFKIETITSNIHKIYVLFYCDKIQSNNPNDKILDNRCVICEENTNTRLNFITPTDDIGIEDIGFASLIRYYPGLYVNESNPLLVFYSKKDGRLLEGVHVIAKLKNRSKEYYDEGISNNEGLVYLPNLMPESYSEGFIIIEYNGETKTIWEGS